MVHTLAGSPPQSQGDAPLHVHRAYESIGVRTFPGLSAGQQYQTTTAIFSLNHFRGSDAKGGEKGM